jgi:rubredoxin
MARYRCTNCGYIYDPVEGDKDGGIPAGTPFEKIPESWVCPVCGAAKSDFEKID